MVVTDGIVVRIDITFIDFVYLFKGDYRTDLYPNIIIGVLNINIVLVD